MKQNKRHIKIPYWLVAAIIYGLSWSMILELNLSFLAWFAFVPLFISLENKNTFWSFYKQALLFSIVAYVIICHAFLFVPKKQLVIIIGSGIELIMSSVSFALFYPFKKRLGFNKALWIFPFIIALWEWIYQHLDFSFGYLMLSHSQCQNIWLIQYIDIFGVWSIASWVMMFNVLLFFQYKKFNKQLFNIIFIKKVTLIAFLMIVPSLIYSLIRYTQIENSNKASINITLINTNFSLLANTYDNYISKIERLTYLVDSTDFSFKQQGKKTDLYVWHEGAVDFGNDSIFYGFIDTAVKDWKTPLLTGMQIIPYNAPKKDRRKVNRATLIQHGISEKKYQHYDKVHLASGYEQIPYINLLSKIPGFPLSIYDSMYFKKGDKVQLIELQTQNGQAIKLGTPICMEQNYPEIWSDMALNGAECFIQLSYEAWWSTTYFKKQMANITRLRAIETKRNVGRCSNGGKTQFYDALGRIYSPAENKEGITNANITLYRISTFFSGFQWFYPIICIFIVSIISILSILKIKK